MRNAVSTGFALGRPEKGEHGLFSPGAEVWVLLGAERSCSPGRENWTGVRWDACRTLTLADEAESWI